MQKAGAKVSTNPKLKIVNNFNRKGCDFEMV
jgi:hypothetical protein